MIYYQVQTICVEKVKKNKKFQNGREKKIYEIEIIVKSSMGMIVSCQKASYYKKQKN